jgi:hypothetical protein
MSSCRSSCGSGVGGALTRVRNPSTALLRSTSLRIGTRPRSSSAPEFPAASSTFDFPLFRGQAGLLGAIECVAWDKVRRLVARATPLGPGALTNESPHGFLQDMLRKEYLGEAAVQVADWFPNSEPVEWSPDLEVCPRPYR